MDNNVLSNYTICCSLWISADSCLCVCVCVCVRACVCERDMHRGERIQWNLKSTSPQGACEKFGLGMFLVAWAFQGGGVIWQRQSSANNVPRPSVHSLPFTFTDVPRAYVSFIEFNVYGRLCAE